MGVLNLPSTSSRGFYTGTAVTSATQIRPLPARAQCLSVEARYRGKGTDLSRVNEYQRHERDTGSTEVQITRLTARIQQLTKHLQEHKKDFGSRRGLQLILSRRRHFMMYLYRHNREQYDKMIAELNIRPLRIQAGRGVVVRATQEGLVVDPDARQAGDVEQENT